MKSWWVPVRVIGKLSKRFCLKHRFSGGSCKYKSSGSHISVNMRANNTRETQELTSGFKQCSLQFFPLAFIRIFYLKYRLFWIFVHKFGVFRQTGWVFSKTLACFDESTWLMLLLWEKDLVRKVKFVWKYFTHFWYTLKRHTIWRIHRKSQIGFRKMVEIWVKSDEHLGKTKNAFQIVFVITNLMVFLYCSNSRK